MTKGFDLILDECLERVLRGESIERCLAAYPGKAAELRPLLEVALAARQASAIEPRPEFKAQAKHQLTSMLQEVAAAKGRRRAPSFHWQRRWATVATALLLVFALGGGTIFASANSMPNDPLYSVKLASEQLQLTFTLSAIDKAKLHAKFADKRVQEMAKAAEEGEAEDVDVLSQRLISHLEKVKLLAASKLEEKAVMEAPALQEEKLGDEAQKSKDLAEREKKLWEAAQREKATVGSFDIAAKDVKVETFAELRQSLEEKAARNQQLLKEALKKATPSSRSALSHAMQKSSQKYEEVLKAIREGGREPPP